MGKQAIVLSGISGTGKTRYRESHLAEFPYVDISDVYKDVPGISWDAAVSAVATRALKLFQEHDTVVIEGYFLKGTPSRLQLIHELRVGGVRVKIINMLEPSLGIIEKRLRDSGRPDWKQKLNIATSVISKRQEDFKLEQGSVDGCRARLTTIERIVPDPFPRLPEE